MSPISSDSVGTATEIEAEFEQLTAEWKQETAHLSSPKMVAAHRAYQEIIGMGKDAIPLILRDLEESPSQCSGSGLSGQLPESPLYVLRTEEMWTP